VAKLEQLVTRLLERPPQSSSTDAIAKEKAHKWMREIMNSLPLNSFDEMKTFNDKLEETEAPYMDAAAENLAPIAKQVPSLSKFYPIIFGDWVTDNVTYARATVSVNSKYVQFVVLHDTIIGV
jgi:hypothetical protein